MPYYIEIECSTCRSKFKIDAENYSNKKISFSCKNCGNKITYFIPPVIQGLSAPKAEISTKKMKKVKEESRKTENVDGNPPKSVSSVKRDKLKLKLPSLFKRKDEADQQPQKPAEIQDMRNEIDSPVSKIASVPQKQSFPPERNKIPESEAKRVGRENNTLSIVEPSNEENIKAQNKIKKPLDFFPPDAGKDLSSAAMPANYQLVKPKLYSGAATARPHSINNGKKSLVHVPKPGMPFIAQLSIPSFYKAGSARRKDYSYILAEISRFRNTLGRDLLSSKIAAAGANKQDFKQPEFTPASETALDAALVAEKQPESPLDAPTPLVNTRPTSAEIEEEAIEFERNLQDEIKPGLPSISVKEDRETKFTFPITPKGTSPARKLPSTAKDSKIFIPLNPNINLSAERSPAVAGRGNAAVGINNLRKDKLITPEIEVTQDSYKSDVPIVPSPIPSYPPLQQPYQHAPSIPPFVGQESDAAQQTQAPFYDLRPDVPQHAPSVPYKTGEELPAPPFLREDIPYQAAGTVQQPVSSEQSERIENVEVPPYLQHETATQRFPKYQQGQGSVQQGDINSFHQKNVDVLPAQSSGQSYVSQPDFQGFGTPGANQQAEAQQSGPAPFDASLPSAPSSQGPFTQMPPEPVPPPSVTSPPPAATLKRPVIIDEDEEDQFGPSNFGLDF